MRIATNKRPVIFSTMHIPRAGRASGVMSPKPVLVRTVTQTVFRGRLPLTKVARAVYRTFYEVENSLRYRSRENFNSLLN